MLPLHYGHHGDPADVTAAPEGSLVRVSGYYRSRTGTLWCFKPALFLLSLVTMEPRIGVGPITSRLQGERSSR